MATFIETLIKFIPRLIHDDTQRKRRPASTFPFPVCSRTLGKVALIETKWVPPSGAEIPKPDEFWRVLLIKDTRPGRPTGTWIVRPLYKVEISDTQRLVPPFFESEQRGSVLYATPINNPAGNWFLPLNLKRSLSVSQGLVSIVVVLQGRDTTSQNRTTVAAGTGQVAIVDHGLKATAGATVTTTQEDGTQVSVPWSGKRGS